MRSPRHLSLCNARTSGVYSDVGLFTCRESFGEDLTELFNLLYSLIDAAVIEELYLASQAGVQIDLIVRGVCSLLPGLHGISECIRVVSIIDRCLEHARIFYFHNGDSTYLLSSADWMPRNLDRRVEIAFPVNSHLQAKLRGRFG